MAQSEPVGGIIIGRAVDRTPTPMIHRPQHDADVANTPEIPS
jgi:hypothetical protein